MDHENEKYLDFRGIGKLKVLDFGYKELPIAAHKGDAGYDVFAIEDTCLLPSETRALDLGFGLELPSGVAGLVLPRSGLARKGITTHSAPVDPNYRGSIHAIMTNQSFEPYDILKGDRIAQLVLFAVYTPRSWRDSNGRNEQGFNSSGR